MRLSEAIRLGAMMKPQSYRGPSCVLASASATCALAAAAEAVGEKRLNVHQLYARWPVLNLEGMRCPVCQELGGTNGWSSAVFTHLNDKHRWTRERIADFIETLEPAQAPQATERAPVEEYAWVQSADVARAD